MLNHTCTGVQNSLAARVSNLISLFLMFLFSYYLRCCHVGTGLKVLLSFCQFSHFFRVADIFLFKCMRFVLLLLLWFFVVLCQVSSSTYWITKFTIFMVIFTASRAFNFIRCIISNPSATPSAMLCTLIITSFVIGSSVHLYLFSWLTLCRLKK